MWKDLYWRRKKQLPLSHKEWLLEKIPDERGTHEQALCCV
ncbi:hypothetical protein SC09_Contig24orf00274 [Bacillus subtilis]|uniref:Uncharacterized protein n=1 Tax=Bacillus subtilis TaxID=1423 RepID=A0A0D1KQT7_BACIU|nr:hypothetical protein SC09_Contig24orf00274 [Bacillus subtilis]